MLYATPTDNLLFESQLINYIKKYLFVVITLIKLIRYSCIS